eukprot:86337_1
MQPYIKPIIVYSVEDTIRNKGYIPLKKISKTLQGCIWKVKKLDKSYIIKVAKKSLHIQSLTINKQGKKIKIAENIVKEASIQKYLTINNPPTSLAKYEDFFQDNCNLYLVMEDAGKELFEFVVKCHTLIKRGLISVKQWKIFCKNALKQMIYLLEWLHDKMHCVHLDLSLDNFVIKNVKLLVDINGKMNISQDFQIKLIDFGLAEIFYSTSNQCEGNEIDFGCTKYCGKTRYLSPEIFYKKYLFDATKADIWSFGVVLFTISVGLAPYNIPWNNDPCFKQIMNG